MAKRVLYVSHNHPSVRPGGAERYALTLHRAMRSTPGWESIFLAHGGPPLTTVKRHHETMLSLVDREPDEYFFHSDMEGFDIFHGLNGRKELWTHYLRDLLRTYRPDVVHFQHSLFLGFEMIREIRNTLPDTAIVYTLHEYVPICHNNGQMVRTVNQDELCTHSSARRCHECFPEHSPQAFFMRRRFVRAMFDLVDVFIAPSRFLRDRYVEWGLPSHQIRVEENGTALLPSLPERDEDRPRNRVGYFGQLNRFKGIHVLLDAMRILKRDGLDVQLFVHGANLDLQGSDFQTHVAHLLTELRGSATIVGRYEPEDLPSLMANVDWVVVPSIWWENSPLVIQEAFHFGRPVICSNIGGMAEKVIDGVNGLHFDARRPESLADTLRRAISAPNLWRSLHDGTPDGYPIEDHARSLSKIYAELLAQRPSAAAVSVVQS